MEQEKGPGVPRWEKEIVQTDSQRGTCHEMSTGNGSSPALTAQMRGGATRAVSWRNQTPHPKNHRKKKESQRVLPAVPNSKASCCRTWWPGRMQNSNRPHQRGTANLSPRARVALTCGLLEAMWMDVTGENITTSVGKWWTTRLWGPQPWRYLELSWTRCCATTLRGPLLLFFCTRGWRDPECHQYSSDSIHLSYGLAGFLWTLHMKLLLLHYLGGNEDLNSFTWTFLSLQRSSSSSYIYTKKSVHWKLQGAAEFSLKTDMEID